MHGEVIDYNKLYNDYAVLGLTQQQCADKMGVSRDTIRKYIKKYNIELPEDIKEQHKRRPSHFKVEVDKELLKELYINQNMTTEETACKLGVTPKVVKLRLAEYGIKKDKQKIFINTNKTIVKKYGDKGLQSEQINERRKQACLAKYGCEYSSQSDEVKNKTKNTCLRKYGVEYSLQSKDVRDKIKHTNLVKYGCESPAQNKDILDKMSQTCMVKYGVGNVSKLFSNQYQKRISMYKKLGKTQEQIELVERVTVSNEAFKAFLSSNCITTTKQVADKLGCDLVAAERLVDVYGCTHLIKHNRSAMELEVKAFIESLGVICHPDRDILSPKEIDIYCPNQKIAIEFNGNYWHSSLRIPKMQHFEKSRSCEVKGIRLIHIYEYEWADDKKREIIKSMLKIALGVVDSKIYARQCDVRKISNCEAKPFNELNHLQGHKNAQVTYGLYYNDALVQLMSFSYHENKKWWEIERGCPGSNNIVVGGVSKLFKHFVKEYNPDAVFSYCDYNKFDGKGYEALGMEFIGYTKPDMKWLMGDGTVLNRSPKKHSILEKESKAKIWGAGSKKYLWKNNTTK